MGHDYSKLLELRLTPHPLSPKPLTLCALSRQQQTDTLTVCCRIDPPWLLPLSLKLLQ